MDSQPRLFCQHYWLYDPPDGLYSQAVCKYCGATKKELNAFAVRGGKVVEPVERGFAIGVNFTQKDLCTTGAYYMQGSYRQPLRQDEDFAYTDSYLT